MPDLATERAHLALADTHVAEGEGRITAQALRVEQLREGGHETGAAEALLLTLHQTLEAWMAHRSIILQEIARLEAEAAP